jgi:hypothetical protein
VQRNTPKADPVTSGIRGGAGRTADMDMGGGMKPGQSPSLENPIRQARWTYHSIWSTVLTLFIGLLVFVMREKFEEISRLSILLNKTREEVARDYITQAEVQRITDHIDQRFNRLEAKIDELIRQKG